MATLLAKIVADFATTLIAGVAIGDTTATLQSATDSDGVALPSGRYFFTIDNGTSKKEHISCSLSGTALTSIKTVSRQGTETSGFARAHRLGASIEITDFAHILQINNLLNGTTNFDASTLLGYDGSVTPITANQFAPKSYVDAAALGTVTVTTIILPGNAGETVSAGNLLYLDVTDGEWKKCDADTAGSVDNIILAIAQGSGTDGNAITGGVMLQGLDTHQTGLTNNTAYYASNTAGEISSTPGTTEVSVGVSRSTTSLLFYPRYNQQLTENQQDALAGTSGTPSASNKFVTDNDTSATPSGSKAIRWSGGAYPAGDGSAITGIELKSEAYTASGAIAQNDTVYVSAANTVKTLYPSAQGTAASITTAPSHMAAIKPLPLSTNGLYLHVSGGCHDSSAVLYAQVRTINAGETDFSNGAEATVYSTGNGVRSYDVCSIGTDKYLFVFQADTAGAAAGIKAVVVTVSGTTVTVGSVVTVEVTGGLAEEVSCSKADTDKGIIFYKDDAGNDIYMKVLSVSGTTITQNTAALLKAGSSIKSISSVQLATDSVAVTYSQLATSLFGSIITISSTTPSAGAEQTLIAASEVYYHKITFISATKLLLTYEEDSANATYARTIAISGATMTASSALALETSIQQIGWGTAVIGTNYALVMAIDTNTNNKLYFLNISSTTPTTVSTQNLAQSSESTFLTTGIVKVSPWTYMCTGVNGDGDYIVKMTVVSSARIGMAESAISDAASGNILIRYKTQTLSGITLTAGSLYYIDDTGQPTVNSSLTAPTLGVAISTTKILLQ